MEAGEREENKPAGNDGKGRDFLSCHRSSPVYYFFLIYAFLYWNIQREPSTKEGGLGRVITDLTNVKRICTLINP